ncbi:ribosome hibernation-promoting factor, HPF/YfiA family [Natranaerobius trueperi]|uniref:Ribosome hibernation promoting factor n=1 Tax=Natranaerobius trueperi TaxID=759412 RepID=A0A226C1E4_9FIRM|nr:ribosome-associated translation inhibitor RaiA [Natranaerobius trueperi]OWZ84842.1 ribosomal subunit interface protein [Natranaerobius trueperi]
MRLTISGKNIDVTNALKEHIQKKFTKLDRHFDDSVEAQVTLSVIKDSHNVEATVFLNGGILLRGEESTGDMYASIDEVVEKVERQVKKHKTRINRKLRQTGGDHLLKETESSVEESDDPKIVKTKRFAIKPMSPEEAVLQMELIGHDFFVFRNAETEEVNVVYKRKDGDYGQIEPEV